MKTLRTVGALVLGAIAAALLCVVVQPVDAGSEVSRYAAMLDDDLDSFLNYVYGEDEACNANVLSRVARSHLAINPVLMGHRQTLTDIVNELRDIVDTLPDEMQLNERHFDECVKRNTAQTLSAPLPQLLNEFSNKANLGGAGIWAFDLRFIAARGLGVSMRTETSGGRRTSRQRNALEHIVSQAAGATWPIVSLVSEEEGNRNVTMALNVREDGSVQLSLSDGESETLHETSLTVADLVAWKRFVLHVDTKLQYLPEDDDAVRLASVITLGSVTDWMENRVWSMSVYSEYMAMRLASELKPVRGVPLLGAYKWADKAAGIIAVDAVKARDRDKPRVKKLVELDQKLSQVLPYSHLCLGGAPTAPSTTGRVRLGVRHVALGIADLSVWQDVIGAKPPTTHEFSRQLFSHCLGSRSTESLKFLY